MQDRQLQARRDIRGDQVGRESCAIGVRAGNLMCAERCCEHPSEHQHDRAQHDYRPSPPTAPISRSREVWIGQRSRRLHPIRIDQSRHSRARSCPQENDVQTTRESPHGSRVDH